MLWGGSSSRAWGVLRLVLLLVFWGVRLPFRLSRLGTWFFLVGGMVS